MSIDVTDAATGWSFSIDTDYTDTKPESSLILRNVAHDGHNFAKAIEALGVRVIVAEVEPPDTVVKLLSHFFFLHFSNFDVSAIKLLNPVDIKMPRVGSTSVFKYLREADEALYLNTYFQDGKNYVVTGARIDFAWPASFAAGKWTNADFDGLSISQIFLFSRYASSPAHEPGGTLTAARCHPMTTVAIAPNANVDKKKRYFKIDSVRFDYRLHLFLDRHHDVDTNATLAQIGNNAGLFCDAESIGGPVNLLGSVIASAVRRSTTTSVTGLAFDAAEKPAVLEVITNGLVKGLSVFNDGSQDRRCWDNVHWWGSRGKGKSMISAPGAFHAAHVHWRWGEAGLNVRSTIPEIDTTGVPSVVSRTPAAHGIRGGLVDPHAWLQTIRVAVAKNEKTLDPMEVDDPKDLCPLDWQTLFTKLRTSPDDIENGEDIVFFYSTEIHSHLVLIQPVYAPNAMPTLVPNQQIGQTQIVCDWTSRAGTVFLHGIFFAHDAESSKFFKVGTTSAEHFPTSASSIRKARQWFRPAY